MFTAKELADKAIESMRRGLAEAGVDPAGLKWRGVPLADLSHDQLAVILADRVRLEDTLRYKRIEFVHRHGTGV